MRVCVYMRALGYVFCIILTRWYIRTCVSHLYTHDGPLIIIQVYKTYYYGIVRIFIHSWHSTSHFWKGSKDDFSYSLPLYHIFSSRGQATWCWFILKLAERVLRYKRLGVVHASTKKRIETLRNLQKVYEQVSQCVCVCECVLCVHGFKFTCV